MTISVGRKSLWAAS